MILKLFTTLTFLSILTLSLLGCQQERYLFQENKAIELIHDEDSLATYGVFSDIHGETEKLKRLVRTMEDTPGLDGFIVLGDTPRNDFLRSGGTREERRSDAEEMIEAYTMLAKAGLPVFITTGNHERKPDYEAAMKKVSKKYKNIIDLTKYRIIDGDDADFISLPGYQIKQSFHEVEDKSVGEKITIAQTFIPADGYFADAETIAATGSLRNGLDDVMILLTHGPPKTFPSSSTSPYAGPGTTYSGEDLGDEATTKMMRKNNLHFALSGHIHEAGGLATTLDGEPIPAGQWADELVLNVGSVELWTLLDKTTSRGMAAIITIDEMKVKYEIIMPKCGAEYCNRS